MILEEEYLVKYFIPNKAHFDMNGSPMERKREDSFMGLLYKGTISLYKAWHVLIYRIIHRKSKIQWREKNPITLMVSINDLI